MNQSYDDVRGRKLCILGLGFNVKEQQFLEYFQQFGPVESAEIMRGANGLPRGFGFVVYSTPAAAEAVLAMAAKQELQINGKRIDPKIAIPKETIQQSNQAAINVTKPSRTTRIFVAKIPPHVTQADLRAYFSNFGELSDCYMPKDFATRAERGIAFLTFNMPETVDAIVETRHVIGGVQVAVDRAAPKSEENNNRKRNHRSRIHFQHQQRSALDVLEHLSKQSRLPNHSLGGYGAGGLGGGAGSLGLGMGDAHPGGALQGMSYQHYNQLLKQLHLYEMAGYGSVEGKVGYPYNRR